MGEEEPPILRMRGHEDAASIYEARKSKHVDDKGMTDLEVMAEMDRVLDISVTETWWCIYCFCCGNGCRPWNEDPICALRRNYCRMLQYTANCQICSGKGMSEDCCGPAGFCRVSQMGSCCSAETDCILCIGSEKVMCCTNVCLCDISLYQELSTSCYDGKGCCSATDVMLCCVSDSTCPPGQIGTETFVLCRKMNPTEKTVETPEAWLRKYRYVRYLYRYTSILVRIAVNRQTTL